MDSAIHRVLLEDRFGITQTRYFTNGLADLTPDQLADYHRCLALLAQGIPVQQVVGHARFCGRPFRVTPDVLIPRPETEDLVQWVIDDVAAAPRQRTDTALRILDIGTGSGCIAVTLALELPSAAVSAIDVSRPALAIARENAAALEASVTFTEQDVLADGFAPADCDIIVSNPPYICHREAADMEPLVLDHEPHRALFVPDDDPLLFYRAIARKAPRDARLYFEVNAAYADLTCQMLRQLGYTDVVLRHDRYDRPRMVRANT